MKFFVILFKNNIFHFEILFLHNGNWRVGKDDYEILIFGFGSKFYFHFHLKNIDEKALLIPLNIFFDFREKTRQI